MPSRLYGRGTRKNKLKKTNPTKQTQKPHEPPKIRNAGLD